MPTAEPAAPPRERAAAGGGELSRRIAWPALAAILAGGLVLRLWGVQQGLPFAYNTDESDHFVARAVAMFEHGTLNPHYFANPPGFTYVLHYLFAIAYGGGAGTLRAFALHPGEVYTLGRIAAGVLGTAAVWLLYLLGTRLFGRRAGLLAAAIEAVAFLPVFYSHLALNDVPTLAPLTLSLLGSAGVLRQGRMRDYALAGIGLGLACASKYTAGIALLPLLAAAAARFLAGPRRGRVAVLAPLAVAGVLALAAFLLANPYALLDYSSFHSELVHQSTLSAEAQGKLGAPHDGGFVYYLWSLTWGLGWVPALAALGGAVLIWWRDRAVAWMLVPPLLAFGVFMGLQGRYFGRWLLPAFPLLCLLAAFFAVWLAGRAAGLLRGGGRRPAIVAGALAAAAVVVALLAQGLVYSVHSGLVLARADTRALTRRWMLAHIPAGTPIVVEPIAPEAWVHDERPGSSTARNPRRWRKYSSLVSRITSTGALSTATRVVTIEDYVRTLAPSLLSYYEGTGYCWVISGSTQSGRAFADPSAVPLAVAYYRALAARASVAFVASPYRRGAKAVPFNFDWSFDYYPLAYERPGPEIVVYRLHGGRCR